MRILQWELWQIINWYDYKVSILPKKQNNIKALEKTSYFCRFSFIGFPLVILPLEKLQCTTKWEAERIEGRKLKKMAECSLIDGLARFVRTAVAASSVIRRHGSSNSSWSVSVEWLVVLHTVYILVSQQHSIVAQEGTKIIKLKQQPVDNETQLVRDWLK